MSEFCQEHQLLGKLEKEKERKGRLMCLGLEQKKAGQGKRWKESGQQSLSNCRKLLRSGATCKLLKSILLNDTAIKSSVR